MPTIDLDFTGLHSLDVDERVPVNMALQAYNCNTDNGSIRGRHGYRKAVTAAIGSGQVQGLARFRPGSSARTVVVRAGEIYTVTDPTSETATDGVASLIAGGPHFTTTEEVSIAQLGQYLYLGGNTSASWKRLKPDFTLETLTPLPALTATGSTSTPSNVLYSAHTINASLGGATANYLSSGWYVLSNATGGGNIVVDLNAAVDYSGYDWLLVYACPLTRGQPGIYPIEIMVGDAAANYVSIGTIVAMDRTSGANAIYCNLRSVPSSIRSAIKKIKFLSTNTTVITYMAIYGHLAIPAKGGTSTQQYQVCYYNSSTAQESILSDIVRVTLSPFTPPSYPNVYSQYQDSFHYDGGVRIALPGSTWVYNYRSESVISGPTESDLVPLATLSGTSGIAAGTAAGEADFIRLYKITESVSNPRRLVKAIANPGTGNAFTVTDDKGDLTLANAGYVASGSPPLCRALCAVNNRLIAAGNPSFPNRVSISSFLPFTQSNDPFPQFPTYDQNDADGWTFDNSPTSGEANIWAGNGDTALYALTNAALYVMPSLVPNSPSYKVMERGVLGRTGALWVEGALYWVSDDGVYTAANRSEVDELTRTIRRVFSEWLIPDSAVCIGYRNRKLIIFQDTKYLRYDFVRGVWSTGVLAHSIVRTAVWRDPASATPQLWLLSSDGYLLRWQESATTDAGTAIANWSYSTGYAVAERNSRGRFLFTDSTGSATVAIYKNSTEYRTLTMATGEKETPYPPDMKGRKWRMVIAAANTVEVRRVQVEFEPVEARGG